MRGHCSKKGMVAPSTGIERRFGLHHLYKVGLDCFVIFLKVQIERCGERWSADCTKLKHLQVCSEKNVCKQPHHGRYGQIFEEIQSWGQLS